MTEQVYDCSYLELLGHRALPMPVDATCPACGAKVYARASGPVGRYPKDGGEPGRNPGTSPRWPLKWFPWGQQHGVPS